MKTPRTAIRYTLHVTSYKLRFLLVVVERSRNTAFFFSALLLFCFSAYGQNPNCYRITFSDKNNSPYSIGRPEEFLSPRAIAKRERFNIPVTEQDLPVNPQYIEAILNFSHEPSQIISKSKWDNSVVIFYPETESCHGIISDMLNHLSFVIDTLPVAYYKLPFRTEEFSKEKEIYQPQTSNSMLSSSCDYDYGKSIDNIKLHKGELLHKAGFCGEGMLIGVFDSSWRGYDTISFFKPLYENGQIWGTRDLVYGINNIYEMGSGHGTFTTSIMASAVEGKLIGTAPKANYFFIRVNSPLDCEQLILEDLWAYASEIADSLGVDVVNSSQGYTTFDYDWQNIYLPADNDGKTSIASRAASTLAQKGIVLVNSAGNEAKTNWKYIIRPADAGNILAVGAVTMNGEAASWSSYGYSSDGRVKPDVAALGEQVWAINSAGKIVKFPVGGTSSAAPIIAGLSACLWQALPQYSAIEVMNLIRQYGDQANNPDDRKGYGIPDFYQCYLDHYIGVHENEKPEVSVYPNPTTGQLRITNYELRILEVEVFDVFGRKQKAESRRQKAEGEVVVDISTLQAGVYFVRILTEKGVVNKKIIKY